jgi:hypothetical protein
VIRIADEGAPEESRLLRNPDKLIRKEELLDAVWGDVAVSENSLTRSIALLRRLLGGCPRLSGRHPLPADSGGTTGPRQSWLQY